MSIFIHGYRLERCFVLDDDADARRAYAFKVEDAELEPVVEDGPLGSIDDTVSRIISESAAVLCDYKLRVGEYARFDGAELVARLYVNRAPVVLCTRYERAELDQIRRYRRYVPSLLTPKELSLTGSLIEGFARCIEEYSGNLSIERRTSRSLIKFDSVIGGFAYFSVLNWNSGEMVRLLITELPEEIQKVAEPGYRCYAQVNAGAERQEDLYFTDWEIG